ncbi:hypothetical protein BB560_003398 [Smittium megazygosporum]|uniref:Coronin n=1 Tax=Smittium megazygosporum TaxID=133381 RepID=A0A2T9ZC34_9FUNG|nr:hypothetical protein BB560_003398 [Smittium megazygosporum]
MHSFVRPSKYRYVYGTAYKRNICYEGLRVSESAWDTNIITVSSKSFAVNWNASGGGAFAVIPLSYTGRIPQSYPLFVGHKGPVTDTCFSPFNNSIIASASEDSTIRIWDIDYDYLTQPEIDPKSENEENVLNSPRSFDNPALVLSGHTKKVCHTKFNPAAENVLASSSGDLTIKLWDVQTGAEKSSFSDFSDNILSFDWNYNGSLIASTNRDKLLRIFDPRSESLVSSTQSHQGSKGSRVIWMGDTGKILTTGFTSSSTREIMVWDPANFSKPLIRLDVDTSSGILMPFYDMGSNMVYLAGKGDGNIRYYEFKDGSLYYLSEYKSSDPQRGMGALPKLSLNYKKFELMRLYKITSTNVIEPISFTAPRKGNSFLPDLYPPTPGQYPALSSKEYFDGETSNPTLIDLKSVYDGETPRIVDKAEADKLQSSAKSLSPALKSPTVAQAEPAQATFVVKPERQPLPRKKESNPFLSEKSKKLLNIISGDDKDEGGHENDEYEVKEENISFSEVKISNYVDHSKAVPSNAESATSITEKVEPIVSEQKDGVKVTKKMEALVISEPPKILSKDEIDQHVQTALDGYKKIMDQQISELQSKIEELQTSALSQTSTMSNEIKLKESEISSLKQSLEEQIKEHSTTFNKMTETVASLENSLNKTSSDLEEAKTDLNNQSSRIKELESQLTKTIESASALAAAAEKL